MSFVTETSTKPKDVSTTKHCCVQDTNNGLVPNKNCCVQDRSNCFVQNNTYCCVQGNEKCPEHKNICEGRNCQQSCCMNINEICLSTTNHCASSYEFCADSACSVHMINDINLLVNEAKSNEKNKRG